MIIKTCGLKSAEIVSHSVKNGAHQVGFIFFEKSPRHVEPKSAFDAAKPARNKADIVAVTVDADDDYLEDIVTNLSPNMLQLHGHESPARVKELKARYNLPVMKAFSISDADDLIKIDPYKDIADRFLLDAKAPKGSEIPGGNGVSFDWSLLEKLDENIPYLLSGGLKADNVCEAVNATRAIGIDLSSGIESAPGVKDVKLMDSFFDAVHACR